MTAHARTGTRRRRLVPFAAALAVAAFAAPGAAHASTLTVEGGDIHYTASPGETNSVFYTRDFGNSPGTITIGDLGADPTFPADRCQSQNGSVVCDGITGTIYVDLGDGNDSSGSPSGDTLANPVVVHGGSGDDHLKASEQGPGGSVLYGDDGTDQLDGGPASDELHGGSGDDTINGFGGSDQLFGEDGNDTLDGDVNKSAAPDLLDGGAGSDRVGGWTGPGGDDHPPVSVTLDGVANDGRAGEGDNVIGIEKLTSHVSGTFVTSDADDQIDVYANLDDGSSTIATNGGNDTITGGTSSETIDAGPGDDNIQAGYGDDTITGGPGRDRIEADRSDSQCGIAQSCELPQGNDRIFARDGEADSITCGPGTDSVVADAIDTVAADCETVDVPGAGGGGNNQGGGGQNAAAKPKAKLTVSVKRHGSVATVNGRVSAKGVRAASFKGKKVTLVLVRGRHTVTKAKVKVGSTGRFTAKLKHAKHGLKLRSSIAATGVSAAGSGRTLTVR